MLTYMLDAVGSLLLYAALFVPLGILVMGWDWSRRELETHRHETLLNLLYFAVKISFFMPIIAGGIVLTRRVIMPTGQLDALSGLWEGLPFWVAVFLAALVHDIVRWFTHWLSHTKWLWPIHAIHHSDPHVTWLTSQRFHPFELVWMVGGLAIVPGLLGMPVEVAQAGMVGREFWGMFAHTRLPWSFGPLKYIFVSPINHQWHHVRDGEGVDKNFGTILAVWDVMAGTFYVPHNDVEPQGASDPDFPEGIVAQTLYPFRKWAEMLAGRQGSESEAA